MAMKSGLTWLCLCLAATVSACGGGDDEGTPTQPSRIDGGYAGSGGTGGGSGGGAGTRSVDAGRGSGGSRAAGGSGGSAGVGGRGGSPEAGASGNDAETDIPQPGAVKRPASNTGKGFFVANNKIYDANGAEFRIRGVNHAHWWGGTGEMAIPHIGKAGANTSRAVFGPSGGADTPALRKSIVERYIANGVVPMVDYHNATCGETAAGLTSAVDFWVGADKAWVQSLERYVMLNITNEWGPNSTLWRDAYKTAVARLRQAGIKNLLVIDAGGDCGQNAQSVQTWGKEVFDSDPEKNIVFSVHMYGFWVDPGNTKAGSWDGRQPYDVDRELAKLNTIGVPIIVGEFSWNGYPDVTYTARAALTAYEKHGVGWLAWMWDNPDGNSPVDMVNANVYNSSADLTPFGKLVIEDAALGLKSTAKRATIF